jgi:hypothetical protein
VLLADSVDVQALAREADAAPLVEGAPQAP